jgi:hypothetical protein
MPRALARSSAAVALLALAVLAFTPSAAQGAPRPVLFSTWCANAHYKPTKIVITCADARAIFYAKTWIRWDATGARATGDFVHADCPPRVPLAACHHNARDAAGIYLYRVRFCRKKGRRYFTRLRLNDHDTTNPYLRTIRLKYPCGYVQ